KFITYILASNVPEILPFVLTALFDFPLALGVAQILAIDLGTDPLPALALGAERPEPDIMRQPPLARALRLVDRNLVGRALWLGALETLLCYVGFFAVYALYGRIALIGRADSGLATAMGPFALAPDSVYQLAATTFFVGVVMGQIGSVFSARRELPEVHRQGWFGNHLLLAAVLFEVGLVLVLIYFEPIATRFGAAPLPVELWAGLILYGPILYGLERLRKGLALRLRRLNAASTPSS
ncbi:MAG TPA: cation-translocating P-type ATPase C-terminal domain-containing protein, partial [Anaerolineales bacterium]